MQVQSNTGNDVRFYRIPKALFEGGTSLEAAALYGLMLDRVGLSARNGWVDGLGRVFIYFAQKDVQRLLRCGHNRATAFMRELERSGLIERKRQGRPARIYVKAPAWAQGQAPAEGPVSEEASALAQGPALTEVPASAQAAAFAQTPVPEEAPDPAKAPVSAQSATPAEVLVLAEVPAFAQAPAPTEAPIPAAAPARWQSGGPALFCAQKRAVRAARPGRSRRPVGGGPDGPERAGNDTEKKKTERNDTHRILPQPPRASGERPRKAEGRMDEMRWMREKIRENVDWEGLVWDYPGDSGLFDGYVELMVEAACSSRESLRICGEDVPAAAVRSRFLHLGREHLLYVRDCLCCGRAAIGNVKAYTLAALYNAPATMEQYYAALASRDEAM